MTAGSDAAADRLDDLVENISSVRRSVQQDRSALVGISGIDASGKGFISRKLAERLESAGCRVAIINVDGWLNLPAVRFSETDVGVHFYKNALRLDEMFERLIEPLRLYRNVDVTIDFTEETASSYRPHRYSFTDVDVILLEGIFIFKRRFVDRFDLRIWIECSFETALERAVTRGQESLSAAETKRAYCTIYFPAQGHHLAIDSPVRTADIIFNNDFPRH
jgi:uridine kinase